MNLTLAPRDSRRHRPERSRQDWETPRQLYDRIAALVGDFDVDAAASYANHKCDRYWTVSDFGLAQDVTGLRVFCNPPFCEVGRWAARAAETRADARLWCLVCTPKTDQAWWHEHRPDWITWIRGRVRFEVGGVPGAQNTSPTALLWYSLQIHVLGHGPNGQAWVALTPYDKRILPYSLSAVVRERGPKLIGGTHA